MTAAYLDISAEQKQEILETIALQPRLDRVLALLAARLEVLRLSAEIGKGKRLAGTLNETTPTFLRGYTLVNGSIGYQHG